MPLKILHPKMNARHKQKIIIIQGKCDNAQKVTGKLVNKGTGQTIAGTKLTTQPKQWGYVYRNLAVGSYKFSIDQVNSPITTDTVDFDVTPPPPPPQPQAPNITYPIVGDEVGIIFYPYGTSNDNINTLVFSGNGQPGSGAVTQQPDPDGNWLGQVDGLETWPSGGGYQLDVANNTGTTTVNNISIASQTGPPIPVP